MLSVASVIPPGDSPSGSHIKPRSLEARNGPIRLPDGKLVALVIHVGKEAGFENYESRGELRTKEGSLLCPADYSSEGSEHGYGVAKAAWTPDAQFFVYSLQSSGGHSPWHTPVQFYNRRQNKVLSLDEVLGDSIAYPEFSIREPDEITLTRYSSQRQMTLRLSELPRANPQKKSRVVTVHCPNPTKL